MTADVPAAEAMDVDKPEPSGKSSGEGEARTEPAASDGQNLVDALRQLDYLMRDFRSEEVLRMDTALLDFLHASQRRLGNDGTYEIISAYRSPTTNAMLRRRGGGVAKRSMHLQGRAIDVRLTGVNTRELRRAARELARGGVGYYAKSDFVHLDTGRVRWW